jgi:ATP-dependent Clp protease ATP-binding subunit ClpA
VGLRCGGGREAPQPHVKKPIADEILCGKLKEGGIVRVEVKDGKLDFEFIPEGPVREPGEDGEVKDEERVR